jgi:hypothetical protein
MKAYTRSPFFPLSLLLGATFLLIYITNRVLLTPEFYRANGQNLALLPGQDLLVYQQMQLRIYPMTALYLLVKVGLISLILYTALYLAGHLVKYAKILHVVIYSELIFVLAAVLKLLWFLWAYPNGTLQDWHHVYLISLLSLFDQVPADWFYALQTINVAEICYWFLLAAGLSNLTRLPYASAIRLVSLSYLPALLIWVTAVTFLSLLFFPNHA